MLIALALTGSSAVAGHVPALAAPVPNDDPSTAIRLDAAHPTAVGQVETDGEVRYYSFVVDQAHADVLQDIDLTWAGAVPRELCLVDVTLTRLQCRTDEANESLTDLLLLPGTYFVTVDGVADPDDSYTLSLGATHPLEPDGETEPNDSPATASPWDTALVMHGSAGEGDDDYFRATVTGAPQLWRLDVTGTGLEQLTWVNGDGTLQAAGDVSSDGTTTTLTDLYLVPGDHIFRIDASGGDYTLTLTSLGAADPNAEREPNNDELTAEPILIGQPIDGRLPQTSDRDVFRFSLAAPEHLGLTVTPPTDASISYSLDGHLTTLLDSVVAAPGADSDQDLWLDAGDYSLTLTPVDASSNPYTVLLQREDPFPSAAPLAATLALTAPSTHIAAYWQTGQRIDAQLAITNTGAADESLQLDALTSHYLFSASMGETQVVVPAGGTLNVPVTILAQPDAWADVPVRVSVRARDGTGAQATTFVDIIPDAESPPVNSVQAWSVPGALLGGLDVAATRLGAVPMPTDDGDSEAQLYDGYTPSSSGFTTAFDGQPITMTVQLAGTDPVPVVGTILNPEGALGAASTPKAFDLLLSPDGLTYTQALSGEMSPLGIDQAFVLPAPVMARFAQLRIDSVQPDGDSLVLGEWKVVAAPGTAIGGEPRNIADPGIGGHIVWMDPQRGSDLAVEMLDEDPNEDFIGLEAGARPQWVIGFNDDRAAQITELQWVDATGSSPASTFSQVEISTSTDSPLGPWTEDGSWDLTRNADGSVQPFEFQQPIWARYVRYSADGPKQAATWAEPSTLRVIERPTGDGYHSVVGEWGAGSDGAYEYFQPPDVADQSTPDQGNHSQETAVPLSPGVREAGRVQTGQSVDWYQVTVPEGTNTLTFTLDGSPFVGTALSLYDATGAEIPTTPASSDIPDTVGYMATVTAGAMYTVKVEQPPFSAVITYDYSGSVDNYLPYIQEALKSFAGGVIPGHEAVKIIPFEDPPLLDEWSDDPYALQDAVEGTPQGVGSSAAESALLNALDVLKGRQGARAILVITDADTTSFDRSTEMWSQLAAVRPLVFSVQIGADATIAQDSHYMQDWAQSDGGFYEYAWSHDEMDRAFDRLATWLRRPAAYGVSFESTFVKPPEPSSQPGTLAVVGTNGDDPSKVPVSANAAIELIFDTSGSMLDRLEGKRRIDIAESVLTNLVRNKLPPGVPLALRVFGDTPASCDTRLAVPLGPLDPEAVAAAINGVHTIASVNTPIGAALKQVSSDLAGVTGPRIVVLVTDGKENCGGDPGAAVKALVMEGLDVHVNIVGFSIDDKAITKQLAAWAKTGHGSFVSASGGSALNAAIAQAVSAPYEVYDQTGKLVGTGTVNGDPIAIKPGSYRVVVVTNPEIDFNGVIVQPGGSLSLTLPSSGASP